MAKTKLNQIIAVVQGKKSRAQQELTAAHRGWNIDAITGISKNYQPKAEDGDRLPPESKMISVNVCDRIRDLKARLVSLWDAVATQETGNTTAKAAVNGADGVGELPVTVLLFLDKQLVDLHTLVTGLPVLPPDRTWRFDGNRNCYITDPVRSIRTQKVPEVITKAGPTKEHPAQTEIYMKDVNVGTWTTTHMSSAIPSKIKAEVLARIEDLRDAVKSARESANSAEVEQVHIGDAILSYVFGSLLEDRVQS